MRCRCDRRRPTRRGRGCRSAGGPHPRASARSDPRHRSSRCRALPKRPRGTHRGRRLRLRAPCRRSCMRANPRASACRRLPTRSDRARGVEDRPALRQRYSTGVESLPPRRSAFRCIERREPRSPFTTPIRSTSPFRQSLRRDRPRRIVETTLCKPRTPTRERCAWRRGSAAHGPPTRHARTHELRACNSTSR